jgi:hypothetical protein
MGMRTLRRILLWIVAALVLAFLVLLFPFDPPEFTAEEIGRRVDLLNEKAAIDTPHHDLGKKVRAENLALFEKVESGKQLTLAESSAYRVLYQSILEQKQHELALLDDQLTVLTNYMPDERNNVGTLGIEGSHDHHDASSGANLEALRGELDRMDSASGVAASITRVRAAIEAWKDLDDIILHMATAPQTKSVPRLPESPRDEMQSRYESMMFHFKRAQFEPVNSPAYAADVHRALDHYDAIVMLVQQRIHSRLGPVERSLSGRWGSWRSLAPSLKGVTTNRIPRTTRAAGEG